MDLGAPDDAAATTGGDGRFDLTGLPADQTLRLRVMSSFGRRHTELVRLSEGEVRSVAVSLEPAGSVHVELLRADGSPMPACLITLEPTSEPAAAEQRREEFASMGTATFEGLSPGEWRVSAVAFALQPGDPEPELRVVTVRAGERTVVRYPDDP